MHGFGPIRASSLRYGRSITGTSVSIRGTLQYGSHARLYSATNRSKLPVTFTKPSTSRFSSIPTCPEPTCECSATPPLPKPIDYEANIRESAPGYIQHVVIATGRSDWASRIEDEGKHASETVRPEAPTPKERFKGFVKSFGRRSSIEGGREVGLARGLKAGLGRHGAYFDPMRPMLITNGSFKPPGTSSTDSESPSEATAAAFLFPEFQYVSGIPDDPQGHEAFLRAFLAGNATAGSNSGPWHTAPVTIPTILICSHGTRDVRCGVLGPLLQDEFRRQLARVGIAVDEAGGHASRANESSPSSTSTWSAANVATVSHIGGHKWAGNVIVYMPLVPTQRAASGLAGKGVWYGRVEPRHVEGIVNETILRGRVIEELCRGVRG